MGSIGKAFRCLLFAGVVCSSLAAQFTVGETRLDTSVPPGSAQASSVQLASSGPNVYATWQDFRSGNIDIYLARSGDFGRTWQDDTRIDVGDPPGSSTSGIPQIAVSGSAVYVAWYDGRDGPYNIYFNRSLDGGATWLPSAVRLNVGVPATQALYPTIAAAGNHVYVAWSEYTGFTYYLNHSADQGTTWQAASTPVAAIGRFPGRMVIEAQGSHVHALYISGVDLSFKRSADFGSTFGNATQLNSSPGLDVSDLSLVVCGSRVHAAWANLFGYFSGSDIHYNSSSDDGATWRANDVRINTGVVPRSNGDDRFPVLACNGHSVFCAWSSARNGGQEDVYFNHSLDGGTTWPADRRLDTGTPEGSFASGLPDIAAIGSRVFAAWHDSADSGSHNGKPDLHFQYSVDEGATWLSTPMTLDSTPSGLSGSYRPALNAGPDGRLYVAWEDTRDGERDMYFTRGRFPFLGIESIPRESLPFHYDLGGADLAETGNRGLVVISGTGDGSSSGGIPLPGTHLFLELDWDALTSLGLSFPLVHTTAPVAQGAASTPDLPFPSVAPGIDVWAAAVTIDSSSKAFVSVTNTFDFTTQ